MTSYFPFSAGWSFTTPSMGPTTLTMSNWTKPQWVVYAWSNNVFNPFVLRGTLTPSAPTLNFGLTTDTNWLLCYKSIEVTSIDATWT